MTKAHLENYLMDVKGYTREDLDEYEDLHDLLTDEDVKECKEYNK